MLKVKLSLFLMFSFFLSSSVSAFHGQAKMVADLNSIMEGTFPLSTLENTNWALPYNRFEWEKNAKVVGLVEQLFQIETPAAKQALNLLISTHPRKLKSPQVFKMYLTGLVEKDFAMSNLVANNETKLSAELSDIYIDYLESIKANGKSIDLAVEGILSKIAASKENVKRIYTLAIGLNLTDPISINTFFDIINFVHQNKESIEQHLDDNLIARGFDQILNSPDYMISAYFHRLGEINLSQQNSTLKLIQKYLSKRNKNPFITMNILEGLSNTDLSQQPEILMLLNSLRASPHQKVSSLAQLLLSKTKIPRSSPVYNTALQELKSADWLKARSALEMLKKSITSDDREAIDFIYNLATNPNDETAIYALEALHDLNVESKGAYTHILKRLSNHEVNAVRHRCIVHLKLASKKKQFN